MFNLKVGDLIYIPANVSMFRDVHVRLANQESATMTEISDTKKPEYGILIENRLDNFSVVLWNGEHWRVNKDDLYKLSQ